MTPQEALDYIASLAPRGWRLGLDRMQALADAAGLLRGPQPKFIHIAGTNGKGTTTAFVQSILREHGFRTGAYFSPFVYDPLERWQINGALILPEELAALTAELKPIAESFTDTEFGGITEFEFKTALGFLFWQRQACDYVALEVGLGGRLDATNIITPASCAIVSIGLDHQNILGETMAEIAYEKAGIIKAGIPVVVGEMADEALKPILAEAARVRAPVMRVGDAVRFALSDEVCTVETARGLYRELTPGIVGAMSAHNLAVAIAAIEAAGVELNEEKVHAGAVKATAPGRFQVVERAGVTWVLDGAHNAEAAEVLAQTFQRRFPGQKAVLITGMLHGHEPDRLFAALRPIVERAFCVPINFHRARSPQEVATAVEAAGIPAQAFGSVREAVAAVKEGVALVTGSYYLVGEVGHELL
ncbi:MAG: bifunctional folylpolyglutamate synthase/dihydrofolate synthase [Armatimonadetes bacterium]|nr:bifunctional folylpolyglutamate synthase/dihydrofolate synthase [Armatimonadota bacterium]